MQDKDENSFINNMIKNREKDDNILYELLSQFGNSLDIAVKILGALYGSVIISSFNAFLNMTKEYIHQQISIRSILAISAAQFSVVALCFLLLHFINIIKISNAKGFVYFLFSAIGYPVISFILIYSIYIFANAFREFIVSVPL